MTAKLTVKVPLGGENLPTAFDSVTSGIKVTEFAVSPDDTTAKGGTEYTITAKIAADESASLIDNPTITINGETVTATANADGSYTVTYTFTAEHDLSVNANMLKGAAIRLSPANGLRFCTVFDAEKIAQLQALGATVELGTLIAPKDLLGDGDLTFDLDESSYINVKYEATDDNGAYSWRDGENGMIAGSIINVNEDSNIAREYIGRGYVKVTLDGKTVISYAQYADGDIANNTRSIAYVANALKNDTAKYSVLDNEIKLRVDNWAAKLNNE